MLISDIPINATDEVDIFAIAKDPCKKPAKNGSTFLAMKLADRSGEVTARMWSLGSDAQIPLNGQIVKVRGTMGQWGEEKQFTVRQWRFAEKGEFDLADLVRKTEISVNDAVSTLRTIISGISNEFIRRLVKLIWDEHHEQIIVWPAAKAKHHSYVGGFLEHVWRMTSAVDALCASPYFGMLNRDVAIAGCILHDVGKFRELLPDSLAVTYTPEGSLLGHIVLAMDMIDEYAKRTLDDADRTPRDRELLLLVKHVVAAHHGRREWGAPQIPMVPEALLVHLLDVFDSRLNAALDALASTEPGQMTPFNQVWETFLYKEKA